MSDRNELALIAAAAKVRENAYAPYSNFKVGAAIRAVSGEIYVGCNAENVSYPEGTCAEAGAISAMIAAGDTEIAEVAVIADGQVPVAPCGGCRQRISEFASGEVKVMMVTTKGGQVSQTVAELLPGRFASDQME